MNLFHEKVSSSRHLEAANWFEICCNGKQRKQLRKIIVTLCEPSTTVFISGTDRTNVCWVKEGCSSLKPAACSSLPLEVVDHVDHFDAEKLNLHLNKGCYTDEKKPLQAQLDNAPASCNPPCFRITKPGEYCYMGTRNNNFSNRRHIGQITVTEATGTVSEWLYFALLSFSLCFDDE